MMLASEAGDSSSGHAWVGGVVRFSQVVHTALSFLPSQTKKKNPHFTDLNFDFLLKVLSILGDLQNREP